MSTFFIVDGVKIELYYKDHNPPHFHAIIAGSNALIEIETQKILEGKLPRNKKKKVLKWAKENKDTLLAIWNELRNK